MSAQMTHPGLDSNHLINVCQTDDVLKRSRMHTHGSGPEQMSRHTRSIRVGDIGYIDKLLRMIIRRTQSSTVRNVTFSYPAIRQTISLFHLRMNQKFLFPRALGVFYLQKTT
jgi:hypothetical protein